jgi:hypothetical protein
VMKMSGLIVSALEYAFLLVMKMTGAIV